MNKAVALSVFIAAVLLVGVSNAGSVIIATVQPIISFNSTTHNYTTSEAITNVTIGSNTQLGANTVLVLHLESATTSNVVLSNSVNTSKEIGRLSFNTLPATKGFNQSIHLDYGQTVNVLNGTISAPPFPLLNKNSTFTTCGQSYNFTDNSVIFKATAPACDNQTINESIGFGQKVSVTDAAVGINDVFWGPKPANNAINLSVGSNYIVPGLNQSIHAVERKLNINTTASFGQTLYFSDTNSTYHVPGVGMILNNTGMLNQIFTQSSCSDVAQNGTFVGACLFLKNLPSYNLTQLCGYQPGENQFRAITTCMYNRDLAFKSNASASYQAMTLWRGNYTALQTGEAGSYSFWQAMGILAAICMIIITCSLGSYVLVRKIAKSVH